MQLYIEPNDFNFVNTFNFYKYNFSLKYYE